MRELPGQVTPGKATAGASQTSSDVNLRAKINTGKLREVHRGCCPPHDFVKRIVIRHAQRNDALLSNRVHMYTDMRRLALLLPASCFFCSFWFGVGLG